MKNPISLIIVFTTTLLSFQLFAAEATPLLKTTTSWNGGAINYPKGQAEISAVRVRVAEGEEVPFHCHPTPTLGYILEGELQVTLKNGEKANFKAGEAVVEVQNTLHQGKAIGGPAEFLAFYAGAKGINNSLKEGDKSCIKGKN